MWNVSLSTMWAIGRFGHLDEFFAVAEQLGIRRFELNHQVSSRMLEGINLNGRRITGVHEPCPADIPTATLKARNWLISSPDEEGRRQGVLAVQRSIDLAQQSGADLVIVHPGRVDVDAMLERKLRDLFDAGQAGTPAYQRLKEELVVARAAKAEANLDAARRSVLELLEYAGRAGVRLGLENRYHYLDIPLVDEMESLLALAGEEEAGFLYDVGHAQTLENLGFSPHEEWLRRYAARMIGVHLHDVQGLRDHCAAGLGKVDWDMVAGYLPANAIRTCEFRNDNTPEQVAAALQFLADQGCIDRPEKE